MHKCPVCDNQTEQLLCSECGFDASRNFEHLPTLAKLNPGQNSVARLRENWLRNIQGQFLCPDCGSRHFTLTQSDLVPMCVRCRREIPNPGMDQLRSQLHHSLRQCADLTVDLNHARLTREDLKSQIQSLTSENQLMQEQILRLQAQLRTARTDTAASGIRLLPSAPNVAVGAGHANSLIIRRNGTIQVSGKFHYDVSGWNGIVSAAGGSGHIVGLRSNGTVVAAGSNNAGQCNVSNWRDITAIAARLFFTLGLKKDGTVVATGSNYGGQCNVSSWRNITAIAAGLTHSVGLRSNGTVIAVGSNSYKECDVYGWRDITAVAAGGAHTVGLRRDGTVVVTGSPAQPECSGWTDIIAIAAGRNHTLGLKRDGIVVAAGLNRGGQCRTEGITNAVAIAAGDNHSIILCADGTFTVIGSYDAKV